MELLPFLTLLFLLFNSIFIFFLFYEFYLKNKFKHRVKDGIIVDISYFKDNDYKGTISIDLTELLKEMFKK
jgi:hypothetical protein